MMFFVNPEVSQVVFYIDPGVGSVIIQVLIGSAIALPFLIKNYWHRIKNVFKREKVDKAV